MLIKAKTDITYPGIGRIVSGSTLRVEPHAGGYRILTGQYAGLRVEAHQARQMDHGRGGLEEGFKPGAKKQYG
jgi:hypothetical protein